MKSTGEVMAIGRTFEESLLKAVRSLEIDRVGLDSSPATDDQILQELREPTSERIFSIAEALRRGFAPEKIAEVTAWDLFFIEKIRHLVQLELRVGESRRARGLLAEAKRAGFADESHATLTRSSVDVIRRCRSRVAYNVDDMCGFEL